jgi:hypothetical protein
MIQCRYRSRLAFESLADSSAEILMTTARYAFPIPPSPRGLTLWYGPRLAPDGSRCSSASPYYLTPLSATRFKPREQPGSDPTRIRNCSKLRKRQAEDFGGLAQAVSVAMGRVDQIQLASYPRNAEAAVWAIAACPALNVGEDSLQQSLEQSSQSTGLEQSRPFVADRVSAGPARSRQTLRPTFRRLGPPLLRVL